MSRRRRNEQLEESLREAFWAAEDATPAQVPDTYVARVAYERDSLSHQILDAVELHMTRHNLTQQALASELGVTEGRISQILSGDQNLTLRTLAGLAAGLRAHFTIGLVPAGDAAGRQTEQAEQPEQADSAAPDDAQPPGVSSGEAPDTAPHTAPSGARRPDARRPEARRSGGRARR